MLLASFRYSSCVRYSCSGLYHTVMETIKRAYQVFIFLVGAFSSCLFLTYVCLLVQ